ncbi:hypothetical protein GCM10027317_21220 [Massilia agri]
MDRKRRRGDDRSGKITHALPVRRAQPANRAIDYQQAPISIALRKLATPWLRRAR